MNVFHQINFVLDCLIFGGNIFKVRENAVLDVNIFEVDLQNLFIDLQSILNIEILKSIF